MMRAVVALAVSASLLGCFPHSPRKRTYAQLVEGGSILAGIAISAIANTTADCDNMSSSPGVMDDDSCKSGAKWATTAGVVLIVGGLLGFVATVSTAEEDAVKPKPVEIKDVTEAKPAATTTQDAAPAATGTGSGDAAGSGTAAAPQQ